MRLFVALDIPKRFCDSLQSAQERFSSCVKAHFTDDFHITLRFLGEIRDLKVRHIKQALHTIKHEPFEITCQELGTFPNSAAPKVLWAGVYTENDALNQLQKKIVHALQPFTFEEKRTFIPHVTLARIQKLRHPKHFHAALKTTCGPFSFSVFKFTLYKSEQTAHGTKYTALERFTL